MNQAHKSGFMLIELLVVIASIGILAALLLSALAAAKHQGQDVKCVSNLKQMTMAGLMYMEEEGPTILAGDTNIYPDSWVGELKPYGVTSNLILCPVTQVQTVESQNNYGQGSASSAWYYWPPETSGPANGSYSINGWFFSYDEYLVSAWTFPPTTPVNNNPEYMFSKPALVQHPAQTPLFNDAIVWAEWPMESDQPAPDLSQGAYNTIWGMPRCTIWRHGGKTATSPVGVQHVMLPPQSIMPNEAAINIGFDDGHAQMVKLNALWQQYWHYNWTPSTTPP